MNRRLARRLSGSIAGFVVLAMLTWAAAASAVRPFNAGAFASGLSWAALVVGLALVGVAITNAQPRNAVGWLFCACPLGISISVAVGAVDEWAIDTHRLTNAAEWAFPFGIAFWAPGLLGMILLLPLLFPDGRPPGVRWRILLVADLVALAVTTAAIAVQPVSLKGHHNPLGISAADSGVVVGTLTVTIAVLIVLGILSAVTRYRRVAGPAERAQMREVLLAMVLTVVGFVLISLVYDHEVVYNFDYALIPAAVALAMLRYHLYDVDVIIRRTLAYVLLTVALALIYLLGVTGIGWALRSVTGQGSAVAVTASTLAAAAAFQPLRRRIRAAVDRRFDRQGYDARAVVERFSGRLREELDLDALCGDLLHVVSGTVRPRHATVWLRPPPDSPQP